MDSAVGTPGVSVPSMLGVLSKPDIIKDMARRARLNPHFGLECLSPWASDTIG